MKLDRLTTSHRPPLPEPAGHPQAGTGVAIQRVDGAEALGPDRQRSLRQEMEEIEARAIGPFDGQERILEDAHLVAETLAHLGPDAARLVRPDLSLPLRPAIDDEA